MTGRLSQDRMLPLVLRLGALLLFFALLEVAILAGWVNRYVVPLPSEIVQALLRIVVEENALGYFAITMLEVFAAAVLLIAIGIPAGVLMAYRSVLWQAWGNWIAGMAAAPLVLLYPLFLVLFGRTPVTIVMIALVTGLPPLILKTVEGIAGTRRVLLDVGRSFNLTGRQLFWKIVLPSAMPAIFLGLRLGMIYAMITVVAVEYLITLGGLGKLVGERAQLYDLSATYAAVCFVVAVSIIYFMLLERIETWLRRSR